MASQLRNEILSHFNEPMLCMGVVVRCVGYGENEMDAYVIILQPKPYRIYPHKPVLRHTCVGGYTFLDRLKGQQHVKAHNEEDWDDLTRLDGDLTRAGAPKEASPIIELSTPVE
jgi:hypothetical protein